MNNWQDNWFDILFKFFISMFVIGIALLIFLLFNAIRGNSSKDKDMYAYISLDGKLMDEGKVEKYYISTNGQASIIFGDSVIVTHISNVVIREDK